MYTVQMYMYMYVMLLQCFIGQTYISCDWAEKIRQECYNSSVAEVCVSVCFVCVCVCVVFFCMCMCIRASRSLHMY